jgi:hypothetical protein
VSPKPRPDDRALGERLEELRRDAEADGDFPDVIAVWAAIERIAVHNRRLMDQGKAPHPFPEWINNYLLRSADKISRLWHGIRPEDDRDLAFVNFNEIGELRKVPQGERRRDNRINHVASALGFVRNGATAFQRHDRARRDADYLRVYDNPDLQGNRPLQTDVRRAVLLAMKKNEHIDTEAAKNRLSKARRAAQRSKRT